MFITHVRFFSFCLSISFLVSMNCAAEGDRPASVWGVVDCTGEEEGVEGMADAFVEELSMLVVAARIRPLEMPAGFQSLSLAAKGSAALAAAEDLTALIWVETEEGRLTANMVSMSPEGILGSVDVVTADVNDPGYLALSVREALNRSVPDETPAESQPPVDAPKEDASRDPVVRDSEKPWEMPPSVPEDPRIRIEETWSTAVYAAVDGGLPDKASLRLIQVSGGVSLYRFFGKRTGLGLFAEGGGGPFVDGSVHGVGSFVAMGGEVALLWRRGRVRFGPVLSVGAYFFSMRLSGVMASKKEEVHSIDWNARGGAGGLVSIKVCPWCRVGVQAMGQASVLIYDYRWASTDERVMITPPASWRLAVSFEISFPRAGKDSER